MPIFLLFVCLLMLGCGGGSARMEEFNTMPVRLPDGATIRAEVMINPQDQARGLMFRESLAPDRGMLFINADENQRPFWMYQVNFPIDIIWLDRNKRVVEVVASAPPCKTKASECPNYGGKARSQYVLELAAGQAAKHNIQVGSAIDF